MVTKFSKFAPILFYVNLMPHKELDELKIIQILKGIEEETICDSELAEVFDVL